MDSVQALDEIRSDQDMRLFMLNLTCFAACIEGLFFFAAFAYVYFLRSRGLLQGLATGTSWVFRDESAHIEFAYEVIATIRRERPHLFDAGFKSQVVEMIREAVDCEAAFADDVLSLGVSGISTANMRQYLQYMADRRLAALGIEPIFGSKNPFDFMELQDVQELTNFFERRVSAYQTGITGEVAFTDEF
jgi:ribonucleoside-diphosphate reductase beta chain